MNLEVVLRSVFGFADFREPQREVIENTVKGQDGLLVMPTGGGKSLCYQLPARVLREQGRGMTVVVSPLIALMKDQVDAARAKGLSASFINSSLRREEREDRQKQLAAGEFELLYLTPERFRKPEFLQALQTQKIALMAVDEAHCISQWGHDFRPDYSRLLELKNLMGNPTCLALTASATQATIADIRAQLAMAESAPTWNLGVRRPNIAMRVVPVYGLEEKVRGIVAEKYHTPGSAIVYGSLIQTLEKISTELSKLGITHDLYHGGLGDKDRKRTQDRWMSSDEGLILATPAFGLGIDKPNVRWVMHIETPGSLEAWTQEVGRAGRDGQPASAITLFDPDDISIQMDFLKWSNPDPTFLRSAYQLISRNLLRARQEGFEYLRRELNFYNTRDFRAETAVNQLERWGCLEGRQPREWTPVSEPEGELVDEELFKKRMLMQNRKLHQLVEFLQLQSESSEKCRAQEIETYFGISPGEKCGICDLCVHPV